jgi:hypothetical protein
MYHALLHHTLFLYSTRAVDGSVHNSPPLFFTHFLSLYFHTKLSRLFIVDIVTVMHFNLLNIALALETS